MMNFIAQLRKREINRYTKIVEKINSEWRSLQNISNINLSKKTCNFRKRFSEGESLRLLLPEVFAVAKEAVYRKFNMVLFDSQLIGGVVLHEGNVAEMQTGEGKTMIGMLAAYLNSISGSTVHIVTANEYLAERDEKWMRPLYELLDISSSINLKSMNIVQKKDAYLSDIIYGTSSEFCFDYLRDSTAMQKNACVQRPLHYVIIDELDSVLIDEAKTPVVISNHELENTYFYYEANSIIIDFIQEGIRILGPQETEGNNGDYVFDDRGRTTYLTEKGYKKIESLIIAKNLIQDHDDLYSTRNVNIMYYINASLRAHVLYKKNVDYIIQSEEVVIVDERTGRLSQGRRWNEGLHQAIEAKEGLTINSDSKTSSSITIQNYFRMYEKISGMTGTAESESFELSKIYELDVVIIPTNKPSSRDDREDLIYTTEQDKNEAIIKEISECFHRKQPVLVGTSSIEQSEKISDLLKEKTIPHQVLNAKQNTKEALIIEKAGEPKSITIATNMAGRGTDIILGGKIEDGSDKLHDKELNQKRQEVVAAGGLHVIGTERQISRRLDNQLKGRAGRQGDPGSSQFYLSFEDRLLRNLTEEKIKNFATFFMKSGKIDGHAVISQSIKDSQYRIERMGFDTRKGLMEYDDIVDVQRKLLKNKRLEILQSSDHSGFIENAQIDASQYIVQKIISGFKNIYDAEDALELIFNIKINIADCLTIKGDRRNILFLKILSQIRNNRKNCFLLLGEKSLKEMENNILLSVFDDKKRDFILKMDELTKSMHFHQYTQNDPVRGYRKHSCEILRSVIQTTSYDLISVLNESYEKLLQEAGF